MNEKEKMKLLRDYKENQISKENGKVLNVKYLGNIYKDDSDKKDIIAVYLIIEQYLKDGRPIEVEQYYSQDLQTGEFEFLAGNNRSDGIEKIYLSDKYINDEKLKESLEQQINELDKDGELDLKRQEQLEEIAKQLGISVEDIESMAELKEEQDLENSQEEKDEQEEDNEQEIDKTKKENESEKVSKKQTEKLIKVSGKQEVNINAKFDGRNQLRNELGLGSEYKSIMVVYSEKLKEVQGKDGKTSSAPVSFLAIKNDGSAQVIDSLELDTSSGNIPTKESIKVNADGTAKQDRNTLARYKTPKGYLSIQRGMYGEMQVYHGFKTKEENIPVEFQLETSNIKPTTKEMRDLQRPGQGEYHIDDIQNEFEVHAEHGEKELKDRADYDGNEETATHVHDDEDLYEEQTNSIVFVQNEIDNWAREIMEDEAVQDVFTENEVKEMIEKYWENDKGKLEKGYDEGEAKEEFDKIKSNIETDAGRMRTK